jgi:type-2 restriction enzyme bsuFI
MFFNRDNSEKFKSGVASKLELDNLLKLIIEEIPKINIDMKKDYSIGYPGCENQFKMDYQIIFHDFEDEIWLIKSTNSIRTDRIYGNEFFAQNIKKLDKRISKIFIVIPDSSITNEKELKQKQNYSSKIVGNTYKSFLDDILTFSEFRNLLIEYATSKINQGIRSNILGNNAEASIVNLLNDKNNLLLWNDYEKNYKNIKSSTYGMFVMILKTAGLFPNKNKLIKIEATKDISLLNNGGKPKTDVKFEIKTNIGTSTYTASIKNSAEKVVTIHEGSVEDIIFCLKVTEESDIAIALKEFQKYGGFKALKEYNFYAYEILESELKKYNRELVNLFYFGIGSPLITSQIQIADMIIYTKNFEIFTKEAYVDKYIKNYSELGQLKTPFKWTYPSGKKGKKIQIKGFTNN